MAPWYAEGTILFQDSDLRVEASILQCEVGKNGLVLSKSKVGKKEGKAKQSRTSNKTEPSNPQAVCGKYRPQQQQTAISTKNLAIMPHTQKF